MEGVAEEVLGALEGHVAQGVAVDLDDAVADGDAPVAVHPAARLHPLRSPIHTTQLGKNSVTTR